MQRLESKAQREHLTKELEVEGWHEPDQREVTVRVAGTLLDNSGFWPEAYPTGVPDVAAEAEMHLVIVQDGVGSRASTSLTCRPGRAEQSWSRSADRRAGCAQHRPSLPALMNRLLPGGRISQ